MPTELLHDPTFATPATYWGQATVTGDPPASVKYTATNFAISGGVATIKTSKYGGFYHDILGQASGVSAPGKKVTATAKVAHTTAPVKVGLYQGSTLLGAATQSAATGATRETLTFDAVVPTTEPLVLRVWAPTANNATSTETMTVEAPSLLEADASAPEPVPEPEPEPEPAPPSTTPDALVAALAPRLAAHIGTSDTDTCASVLPVVIEFVKAYVRDKGFGPDGYSPERPLQAVIISAAARLATNPEQVLQFQAGDYSERPAILNGFTLAELAVLHRYRRRSW